MSAFGQAGFGSSNRRRQLQAQGQMDPYGQQVRAAKQAPTFNIYQTQQPAQQPASQQAKPPAAPAAPAMQAYSPGQTAQPTATPGTAQPIQPQSQGTPYSPQAIPPGQATASPKAADYSRLTDAEYDDLRSRIADDNRYSVQKGRKPAPVPPPRQKGPSAEWAKIAQAAGPSRDDTLNWLALEQNARKQFGEQWYQANVSQPRQMSYENMTARRQELRDAGYMA